MASSTASQSQTPTCGYFLLEGFCIVPVAYPVEDIIFKWKEPGYPIQIARQAVRDTFPVSRFGHLYCSGKFSCLEFKMVYQRDTQYYLLHTFLPSALLVAASWGLGFLMDRGAIAARGLVVFSALLGLTFIFAEVPKLDYFKAIDVWFAGCFLFLLAELVVFAVVGSPETDSESAHTSRAEGDDVTVLIELDTSNALRDRPPQVEPRERHRASVYRQILQKLPSDPGHHINRIFCCALPILYLLFSAEYFLHYCYYAEDYEKY